MAQRSGPTTIRYVHFSGPRPDDDDESDIVFDYDYYDKYTDYGHSRNARPRSYIREELPLSSDSFGHRRARSAADNDARDKNTRAKRSDQQHPRAAVDSVAAGAATGAAVGGYMASRHRERDKALRDAPKTRSMPATSAGLKYKTPQGRPPLPKGWAPVYSTAHGRWYYVNKRLGRTQWEAPGFEHSRERGMMSDKGGRQAPVQNRSRRPSSHSHSLSITGVLLGAASGIAAGTLAAKALEKKRLSSRSARSDHRQDKETRDDRSDFEEDNVPGYRHSHSESIHDSGPGHGHDSDDSDDIDDSDD